MILLESPPLSIPRHPRSPEEGSSLFGGNQRSSISSSGSGRVTSLSLARNSRGSTDSTTNDTDENREAKTEGAPDKYQPPFRRNMASVLGTLNAVAAQPINRGDGSGSGNQRVETIRPPSSQQKQHNQQHNQHGRGKPNKSPGHKPGPSSSQKRNKKKPIA